MVVLAVVGCAAVGAPVAQGSAHAGLATGQSSAAPRSDAPRFAVVSIKPVPDNAPAVQHGRGWGPFQKGGEYSNPRATFGELLLEAYDLPAYRFDLKALPGWAWTTVYSVDAEPAEGFPNLPAAENVREIRLMLQATLADRFQLVLHHQTRKTSIYEMTLAKPALKNVTAGDPSKPGGLGSVSEEGMVLLRGTNVTMGALGGRVGRILGRPVIDKTGLDGVYDFDVQSQTADAGASAPGDGSCGPDCVSLLIGTLSEQLGLKLHATTAPIDFIVVDHVEKPTGN